MPEKACESWERALQAYKYDVDLTTFKYSDNYPGWFKYSDSPLNGDLGETKVFEGRFRKLGPHHLEAWYEVVYWKNYSRGQGPASHRTQEVIRYIEESGVTARCLWLLCVSYMRDPDRYSFDRFRKKLVKSNQVAIAATFPAFVDPYRFPMVDTHVAQWAKLNGAKHKYAQCTLSNAPDLTGSVKTLRDDLSIHRKFIESWIVWCRFTACKLTALHRPRVASQRRRNGSLHGTKMWIELKSALWLSGTLPEVRGHRS